MVQCELATQQITKNTFVVNQVCTKIVYKKNMSQSDLPNPKKQGVAFEVNFGAPSQRRQALPPKRVKRLEVKQRKTDKHAIDAKLQKAAEKKKVQEEQRLDRIHARQEHCRKMATKMDMLLQQDAKRSGMEGTENIPAMSRKQAATMLQSVARDFQSMGSEMQQNLPETDT
ncbi:uncharacterized protein [Amphiura filiformis]|uniref:uncharacterized protein n=1 Tax=Amphiura filiformis TaxID=82378 RepID=UPI003B22392F